MKTRSEIDAALDQLQQQLKDLVARLEPDQVLEAFAAAAEPLTSQPPAEQEAYVHRRINCMLADAGLAAGETEGEPCPKGG